MNKLERRIESWAERTHVYVDFASTGPYVHYVKLEGTFYDDDLADIASILRKMRKQAENKAQKESAQLALLDTEDDRD